MDSEDAAGVALGILFLAGVLIGAVALLIGAVVWIVTHLWPVLLLGVLVGLAWYLRPFISMNTARKRLEQRKQLAIREIDMIYADTRDRMRELARRHRESR